MSEERNVTMEQMQVLADIDTRYIDALKELSPSYSALNSATIEESTGKISLKKVKTDIDAVKFILDLESEEFPINMDDVKFIGLEKILLLFKYKKKMTITKTKEFFTKAQSTTVSVLEEEIKEYVKSQTPEKELSLEDIAIQDADSKLKDYFETNKSKDVKLYLALYFLQMSADELDVFVQKCREEKEKFKPADNRELSNEELEDFVEDMEDTDGL